jgi:AcrR family transcriptional regulator
MEKATATRERILEAAFELISSTGYLGASTRKIAQKAGVAEVTLFRHFKNKESLFTEVLRSFTSLPALSELGPQLKSRSYEEALEALTSLYLERLEANRNWIRVLSCELSHAPEEMKTAYDDFLQQLFGVLNDFFADSRERGVIRPDLDPGHAARAFHSMMFGFFHIEGLRGIKAGHVTEYAEMVDVFVDIFCRGTKTLN